MIKMPLTFHIDQREGYLHVEVSGTFDLEQAKKSFRTFFDAAHAHSLSKILIDCRKMEGSPQDLGRYQLAEAIAAQAGGSFRLVFLRKVKEPISDRFYETVAFNRGVNLKVTTDPEEAFKWLEIKPPNNTAAAA